ncbi:MAG: Ig-like domain-containing protein [Anaerolineaceae bacterium]|nr:Ig-like domain-containing protein [Anaerolineaceae bacterium]
MNELERPFIQPEQTPTNAVQVTQPVSLPPSLVETTPLANSTLIPDEGILFYFSLPMDRQSVEESLQFSPELSGSFDWIDDATVRFRPEGGLPADASVTVTVPTTIRDLNGLNIPQASQVTFHTPDYLKIVEQMPGPATVEVDPSSAIMVAFNQPVVGLAQENNDFQAAFSLEPAATGRGEWLNTSTYIFYPEPALQGGEEYTIHLNPSLRSLVGTGLAPDANDPQSWSFSTALPYIVELQPDASQTIDLDAGFTLDFNQPMDTDSLEGQMRLTDPYNQMVSGSFTWNDSHTRVAFQPAQLLLRDTTYRLYLPSTVLSQGGTPLGSDSVNLFVTVPPFALVGTQPDTGEALNVYSGYTSFSLAFNSPVAEQDFASRIQTYPEISDQSIYLDNEGKTVVVSGYFQPSTIYTVTLAPELRDRWGQRLGISTELNIRTSAAMTTFNVPILQNYNTAIFVRPTDPSLVAQVINLRDLNLSSRQLSLEEFIQLASADTRADLLDQYPSQASWSQRFDLVLDHSSIVEVPLTPGGGTLDSGLYLFRANSPELDTEGSYNPAPFLAVSSRVQLSVKRSQGQVLVWAVNLDDNQPLGGADLTVYDAAGSVIGSCKTDSQGVCQVELPVSIDPAAHLYVVSGNPGDELFSLATDAWTMGVAGWNFGLPTQSAGDPTHIYLYTDRPIYRPGQTINFKAIVRQADNGRYSASPLTQLTFKVLAGYSEQTGQRPLVTLISLPLNEYGTATGSFNLPQDAQAGVYSLEVEDYTDVQYSFQVAEYIKPEIDLQAAFAQDEWLADQSLAASVQASYYFGAPAGNLDVHWALYSLPGVFRLPSGYQTGAQHLLWDPSLAMYDTGGGLGVFLLEGTDQTDADGHLTISLPASQLRSSPYAGNLQDLTLEVTVQDENQQPVSARATTTLHPADFYVGVKAENWNGVAGQEMGFDVQTVDLAGQPSSGYDLEAVFRKVTWRQEHNPYWGVSEGDLVPEYELIGSVDFTVNPDGQARLAFVPPEPGTYELEVSGQGALTQTTVWVSGPTAALWPEQANQQITLTTDAGEYRPGQVARILIPNPMQGQVLAWVTVERSRVMRSQVLAFNGSSYELGLPLGDEDAPNIYVSVTLLGMDENGNPDFRQGYVEIPVEPVSETLQVQLLTQPDKAQPGEECTLTLQVSDASGQPVQGEFSLALVDKAVLALVDPLNQGIVDAFYGQQPLGVTNSLSMASFARRANLSLLGRGGGGEGSAAVTLRQDFPDTAYWSGTIVTNESGIAQVTLTLPDSLTTWVADVRGITQDSRVGEAHNEITVSKSLLIRPVTPQFLVAGDHVRVGAIVQNNTEADLDVAVNLQANGLTLDGDSTPDRTVPVPAGGRREVYWWGITQEVEQVELIFSASSGDLSDVTRPTTGMLPVLQYRALQTYGTAGILEENQSEQVEMVNLPRSVVPAGGQFVIEAAPSLAAGVLDSLDAIQSYPSDFTEPVVSRVLPDLAVYDLLNSYNLDAPGLETRLQADIQQGINRLVGQQNADGGWGWSQGNSSDSYVTAYVLFGLYRASQAGVFLDQAIIQNAQNYLIATLMNPAMTSEPWQLDRQVFQYYVLLQSGRNDLDIRQFYDVRDRLNPWSKALLALSLSTADPADEQARSLLAEVRTDVLRSSTGAHWEDEFPSTANLSTANFSTAVVVYALAQLDPASTLLADGVRYLAANRSSGGSWSSSYEAAWALLGLAEAIRGTGDLQSDLAYNVLLNNNPLLQGETVGAEALTPVNASVPLSQLLADSPNVLRINRVSGSGRLYYRAYLQLDQPVESAQAVERGLTLDRQYFLAYDDCRAGSCQPLQSVQLGAPSPVIEVHLSLTLPEEMQYLVVEDLIPAGAEIIDTSLKTAQQGAVQDALLYDYRDPYQDGWGWWYFNQPQIYTDRIRWIARDIPAGSYELVYRILPTLAGEFHILPAHAYQYYFPEVEGSSAGGILEVLPAASE